MGNYVFSAECSSPIQPRTSAGISSDIAAPLFFILPVSRTNSLDDSFAVQRADWASRFTGLLGYSNVGLLFWNAIDTGFSQTYEQLHTAMRDEPPVDTRPSVSGPKRVFEDRKALDRFLAEVWKDSSLQMQALAQANGRGCGGLWRPRGSGGCPSAG